MNNSAEYLFVYGSLRKPIAHPRRQILDLHASYIGAAVFRGKLFMVKDYPGAVESKSPNDQVLGELYRLSDPDKIFKKLDLYEGYDAENRSGSLFIRSRQEVTFIENGKEIEAWIYLYNRSTRPLRQISSGDYLKYINGDQS